MFKYKIVSLITLIVILLGCGTGIGNGIWGGSNDVGSSTAGQSVLDFNAPIDQYANDNSADCGSLTEDATVAEVDAGRSCIRDAFDSCTESTYLFNKHNTDGSRFVSFVSVEKSSAKCLIHVHTVSDDPVYPVGDAELSCFSLSTDELPELACGIGN